MKDEQGDIKMEATGKSITQEEIKCTKGETQQRNNNDRDTNKKTKYENKTNVNTNDTTMEEVMNDDATIVSNETKSLAASAKEITSPIDI